MALDTRLSEYRNVGNYSVRNIDYPLGVHKRGVTAFWRALTEMRGQHSTVATFLKITS